MVLGGQVGANVSPYLYAPRPYGTLRVAPAISVAGASMASPVPTAGVPGFRRKSNPVTVPSGKLVKLLNSDGAPYWPTTLSSP